MIKDNNRLRLWPVMLVAVIVWTIGVGFSRTLSASDEETYRGLKTFSEVIEQIERNYVDPVDSKDLIEKAIEGMVRSLDPHSSFMPPDELEELRVGTKGEFGGIGISIVMRDGYVTVISPIEGTPAYKAGIKTWDRIIKVDGEPTRDLRDAVKRMRGPKGTPVTVTVMRKGLADPIDFNLVRDIIEVESVRSLMLEPGYGYVWITNFQEDTTEELEAALEKLESGEKPPLKGLILDLRDNPGGLLPQAISVSEMFLNSGKILTIEGRLKQHTKVFEAHPADVPRNYPMVVLINGGSASASEIVAGALQDNKRAVLLGTTSFGKGSVQTVETLYGGYGLKLTVARYFTPSGRSIQAKGIEPDIVVSRRVLEEGEEPSADDGRIHEKDLKNHLKAAPSDTDDDKDAAPAADKPKPADETELDDTRFRHGPLSLETLRSDQQVMRALELLVGHGILAREAADDAAAVAN